MQRKNMIISSPIDIPKQEKLFNQADDIFVGNPTKYYQSPLYLDKASFNALCREREAMFNSQKRNSYECYKDAESRNEPMSPDLRIQVSLK